MIICAGNNETFDFAQPMGVGLIETSMNLTRACLFDKPEYILFIGSAGSYGNKKIFDIIETSSASNIEHCFFQKQCYTHQFRESIFFAYLKSFHKPFLL